MITSDLMSTSTCISIYTSLSTCISYFPDYLYKNIVRYLNACRAYTQGRSFYTKYDNAFRYHSAYLLEFPCHVLCTAHVNYFRLCFFNVLWICESNIPFRYMMRDIPSRKSFKFSRIEILANGECRQYQTSSFLYWSIAYLH